MRQSESPKQILVVEDDVPLLRSLDKRLTHAGFAVLTACRAEEALELARTQPPDAITLDIRLPDFDGLELASMLDENPLTARTPVVFITGKVDTYLKNVVKANPRRYFIHKPYDPELLIRLLKSILGQDALAEVRQIATAKRRQPV